MSPERPVCPGVKGSAFTTILALLLLSGGLPIPVGAGEVETTTRATSARRTVSRMSASLGAVRAVAVDSRGVEEEGRTTFGLEAGPLVFGPVDPTGLHRLSAAPLGFVAGSSVFGEQTGLSLDTSMEPTSRVGGGLELLQGALALSVFEDDDARTGAVALRLGRAAVAGLGMETLLSVSDARERPAGNSWYPDEPGFAGGLLVHGGLLASLTPAAGGTPLRRGPQPGGAPGPAESASAAGGRLRLTHLGVTVLGSAGSFARPGGAAHLRAKFSGTVGDTAAGRASAAATAVLGVEHPWYRDRTGKRPPERAAARVSLSGGGDVARVSVRGRAVVEDRPLEIGAKFPRELALAPAIEIGTGAGPRGEVAAERVWLRDSDGERRRDGEVEVGVGHRRELLKTGVEIRRRWEGAEYEDAVRGELTLGGADAPAGLRFEHWARVSWPDGVGGGGAGEPPSGGGAGGGGHGGGAGTGSAGGRRAAPPRVEGAAGFRVSPGPVTVSLRVETERPIELSGAGRRAVEEAPFEYLSIRLELRLRVAVADLDAQHESGYLEVYGKPDNVDDGGHEGAGHDGGIESESMNDERRNDTDNR